MTDESPAGAAGARQIAEAAARVWQMVDDALSPVIGQRATGALYKRTLHVACRAHPWLRSAYDAQVPVGDYVLLRTTLAQQSATQAAAGHREMIHGFEQLLGSLVGPALTQRLLRDLQQPLPASPFAEDLTSPDGKAR